MERCLTLDEARKQECIWGKLCSEEDCSDCRHFYPFADNGMAYEDFTEKQFEQYWKDWLAAWNDFVEKIGADKE